ncbi:AfsR/SARP family transcriptional regulator [Phytohabitans kaempferiae]|uniref:BTAD domain-containing putative transcriptional regulator n=1 Tax=Phytohabitans kaempferiae TaxID=1620943 RepID=A0ABV6MF43_9ACTN
MDIRLLGDVEIESGGVIFPLERAAERAVLAILAFNAGRVMPVTMLVDHLWGDDPPAKAEETVGSYVRAVRRVIERAGGGREWVGNRRLDGYRLDVNPGIVDHRRFVDLSSSARMLSRQSDHSPAIEAFERALRLWRGEALANVTGQWAESRRYRLRRERLDVTYELLALLLRAGAYAEVASRAADLVEEEPTDRGIALAVRGLAGSGQQALIPSFMSRTVALMWETNQVRPSAELVALARNLAKPSSDERKVVESPQKTDSKGTTIMTVTHSQNVHQSAGDQYFIG